MSVSLPLGLVYLISELRIAIATEKNLIRKVGTQEMSDKSCGVQGTDDFEQQLQRHSACGRLE